MVCRRWIHKDVLFVPRLTNVRKASVLLPFFFCVCLLSFVFMPNLRWFYSYSTDGLCLGTTCCFRILFTRVSGPILNLRFLRSTIRATGILKMEPSIGRKFTRASYWPLRRVSNENAIY